jgi:cytochrome c peroxidase
MRTNHDDEDDSLWTLAGCVAIEAMGGPSIPWKAGRTDYEDASKVRSAFTATRSQTESCFLYLNEQCAPNGRLPDASQASSHLRLVLAFRKMWKY